MAGAIDHVADPGSPSERAEVVEDSIAINDHAAVGAVVGAGGASDLAEGIDRARHAVPTARKRAQVGHGIKVCAAQREETANDSRKTIRIVLEVVMLSPFSRRWNGKLDAHILAEGKGLVVKEM